MFNGRIVDTPFATEYADDYFGNKVFVRNSTEPDMTFLSSLRALVGPRLGDDCLILTRYAMAYTSEYSDEDACRYAFGFLNQGISNQFGVLSVAVPDEDKERAIAAFDSDTRKRRFPQWHRVEKVTAFFKKVMWADAYINPDTKSVLVIAECDKMWRNHYLQCAIPVLLPWYFDERPLTDIEVELIMSLREKESAKYLEVLERMAAQYNFREEKIKKLLNGFESRFAVQEAENTRVRIVNIIDEINRLNSRINSYMDERRNLNITLLGLEAEIAKGNSESEIAGYFMRNNNLVLRRVSDRSMEFFVKGYLTYYDEEAARVILDNPNSYFYRPSNVSGSLIPHNDMKMLMEAILIDQKLRLRMCSAYRLYLGSGVDGISGYNYGAEAAGYTPNPHIDQYSCLGNYTRAINEFINRNDYIGAVAQCEASCASLNIQEGPTMDVLMSRFHRLDGGGVNIRCIELPDGSIATPREAIKWLKKESEGENEQDN